MRAKVAWCSLPLVWWPGGVHGCDFEAIGLPSGPESVRRALSGRPEGLYALKVGLADAMPSSAVHRTQGRHLGVRVESAWRIGSREVRQAIDGLIRSARVREELEFDVEQWRRDLGRRVGSVEKALTCPRVRQAICVVAPEAPLGESRRDLHRVLGWHTGAVARLPEAPGRIRWLLGRPALVEHGDVALDELHLLRPTASPWPVLEAVASLAIHGVRGPDVARLVGHLAGWGVTDFTGLVPWFRHASSDGLALEVLETALARGGRRASDAQALIEVLALSGDTLLRQRTHDAYELCSRALGSPAHVLGQLGDLDAFERLAAVEICRYDTLECIAMNRPAALGPYLHEVIADRFREVGRARWLARAFSLLSPSVVARLLDRFARRRMPPSTRARALGAFLDGIDGVWKPSARADDQVTRLLDAGIVDTLLACDDPDLLKRVKRVRLAIEALDAGLDHDRLLRASFSWDGNANLDAWQCRLVVWLAGDRPGRVRPLLTAIPANTDVKHHPLKGLLALQPMPRVRYALQSACVRPEDIPRVVTVLARVTLVERYPAFRDVLNAVESVLGYPGEPVHRLAQLSRALPKSVVLAQTGIERLQREVAALEATGRAPERLAYIRDRLESPTLERSYAVEAERQVEKHLRLAHLRLIEEAVRRVFLEHWKGRPRLGADWDNAERLLRSTPQNRRLLRRLLRAEAHGIDLRRTHPQNRKVLARFVEQGIDVEAWLGRFAWTEPRSGWRVRFAQDALEVLQMGNRFATCLAQGGCNQHATIANAVEANKRVLYLEDKSGKLRGRRLIGLQKNRLVAFDAYGVSNHGQWVRIALDLACHELARRIGAELMDSKGFDSFGDDSDLELFADWYNDGAEEVDWWVRLERDAIRAELARPERWKDRKPSLRAIIWLGDEPGDFEHLKVDERSFVQTADKMRR
ncbi:MAG: hypothetical protein GY913_10995 [Proteobacteria bacterium]|nr:hypothetical protein [Pseudomonadota bacterium]MCP4917440.1 hypothetical protein [Pseudomonadota bacterium]